MYQRRSGGWYVSTRFLLHTVALYLHSFWSTPNGPFPSPIRPFPQNYNFSHLKHGHEASLPLPLGVQSSESFQLQLGKAPWPLTRGSARPGPRCGLYPQTLVIGSHFALAMVRAPPLFIQIYAYSPSANAELLVKVQQAHSLVLPSDDYQQFFRQL